jgi:hypothetical protein
MLVVEVIQHVEGPKSPTIEERVTHKIDGPAGVRHQWHRQRLRTARRQPSFTLAALVQSELTVHAMDSFVVPRIATTP